MSHAPSSLRIVLPLAAVLSLTAAAADAQVVNRPTQRAFRGLFGGHPATDPNRTHQTLVFTANALGGYDDNGGTGTDQAGPPGTPAGPGSTAVFDLGLRYERSRADRTFYLGGLGSLAEYENVNLPSGKSGGLEVGARGPLGRRTTLAVDAAVEYATQLQIASALSGGADPTLEPSSPSAVALGDRPSWQSNAAGALSHAWNRRQTTEIRASYNTSQFQDDLAGDYEGRRAGISHKRQMNRSLFIKGGYDYGNARFGLGPGDPGRPLLEHRIAGGFDVSRRLDSRRSLVLAAEGGALRVESSGAPSNERYQIWTPFVSARAQADLSQDWYLFGQYRRGAETVPGLSISDAAEAYITDNVNASLTGLLTDRVDLVLSGAFAAGSVGGGASRSQYRTSGGSVQVRVAVTRMLAVVTSYYHYRYEFTDTVLPDGFPPAYNRNAVRVGLSLWLPMYGGYTDRRP